ncbi:phosphofructokinase-domain-containing protein [Neocallimastix lanati (nom. inval.)]|jgi:6-phosphofructokinase 1|nr:phosphofructokinase-domain-containing protein [Neocallimastix sp. JGI-2020a]
MESEGSNGISIIDNNSNNDNINVIDPKNIPIAKNNIERSSHYTLVVNNKQLYELTINFYVNLGFKIENLHSKYNYKHEFEATTWEDNHYNKTLVEYSEDEHTLFDEETWLILENENGKAKLRIVENLHKEFAVADFSQVSDEKLHKLLLNHTSLEKAYMTFSAKLDEIEKKFKEMKRPHKILKSPILGTDLMYKQIYTYDPLLNLIEFHDKSEYDKLVDVNESTEQSKKKGLINEKPEKKIAIMTSGKETSGMNAAIRALVRCGLTEKITPYIVFNGYKGLVKGENSIKKAGWEDVRDLLTLGGTVLDSSDCSYISTHENRLKAAKNLFEQGIKYLIIIGDNESFSYAEILQNEWNDLIHELIKSNSIKSSFSDDTKYSVSIIALPATIDNDIAMTDLTLGTCTSLERICEALDSLESTATSHQRCFIIKVVGKRCGWLALMAAIAVGADCTFIPECPPPFQKDIDITWEKEMCEIIKTKREKGNRKNIIVVSEGATDKSLNPITATYIKEVIEQNLNIDTRITTLGHIQREGIPCAYDRFLATVQAAEIIKEVLNAKENEAMSILIGIRNNMLTKIPLSESVKLTTSISEAIANKEFEKVLNLRDQDFRASYSAYMESTLFSSDAKKLDEENRLRIGIIHVGSPAGGMNAATRAAVRLCLNRGHTPVGIFNSFSGLVNGEVRPLTWQEVSGWTTIGGSKLGINRSQPTPVLNSKKLYKKYNIDPSELIDIGLIAYHLQSQNIQGLLIIGGYEAYCSLYTLYEAKTIYPSLCIPIVQIAATVSNNIPGTDYSIGSDTALNTIVQSCDNIKLSASASQKRVFIVEVQGGNCGYLSTMGGLACGVTCTYGPENGISLNKLKNDIRHLTRRYKEAELKGTKNEGRIIIRNEFTNSSTYSTKVISAILNEEGNGLFDSRTAILGHLQQGGIPSPLDRIRAVRQAVECINWLEKKTKENKKISSYKKYHKVTKKNELQEKVDKEAYVIGIRGDKLVFTSVNELIKETNIDLRKTSHNWWMKYYPLIKILSKYYYFDVNDETDIDYLTNEKNI